MNAKNRIFEQENHDYDNESTFSGRSGCTGDRSQCEARHRSSFSNSNRFLDRPGNDEIQLALLYSYGTNPPLYLQWQEYFRKYQPPTLIVWGKNDDIFPAEGAYPYKDDLKDVEFHLLDTGHFALEEEGDAIADHIRRFMTTHVGQSQDGSNAIL